MKCPQCQSEFQLSWKLYLRLSFAFNRFESPCCKAKVKVKTSWPEIIFMVPFGLLLGMGATHIVINNFHILLKLLAVSILLLVFIGDKYVDSKREVILRGST